MPPGLERARAGGVDAARRWRRLRGASGRRRRPRAARGERADGARSRRSKACSRTSTPASPYASGADLHFLGVLYRVEVTGGRLTDEVDGSTDRCGWFGRDEVAQPEAGVGRTARDRSRVARRARMKSAISIDVAAAAGGRVRPRAGRGALAAAAPPLRGRPDPRTAARWQRGRPHDRSTAGVRAARPRPAGGVAVANVERARDVPDPVRPPGRRDERDGRHVADRGDRGRLPGDDRARLPAAVRAVGTVHRPVLHPPDRRTDARHVQGDRGGGGGRRSRARDGAVAGAGAAPATEAFASRSSRPTKGADSESPPASKRSA